MATSYSDTAPVLYTFRRCPYAMRARMALVYAGINFQVREVELKHKPHQLLDASAKGTVPVLVLDGGGILQESLDILHWSLGNNDPQGWKNFTQPELRAMAELVEENDFSFKPNLDRYKYFERHPQFSQQQHRIQGELFLQNLEARLQRNAGVEEQPCFLFGARLSYADIALVPFIRQFDNVDADWFRTSPYPQLRQWLQAILASDLFQSIMLKYPPWQTSDEVTLFFDRELS